METSGVTHVCVQDLRAERISTEIGYGPDSRQSTLRIGEVAVIVTGGPSELLLQAEAMTKLATEASRIAVWAHKRAEWLGRDDQLQRHAAFHLLEGCCEHGYAGASRPSCCFCDTKVPCEQFLASFATWQAAVEARIA